MISKKAKNQKPEEKKIPAKKTVNKTPSSPGNLYKFLTKSAIIAWIAGSIIFFAIIIISNTIFYKKLQKSRKHIYTNISGINVFISGIINTPCIAGILKPSVYLPAYNNKDYLNHNNTYSTNNEYLKQILAHEYTHIKHKDNIWSLMRIICLCIYWFDPFVWAAAFYSKQDAELACDEAVLKNCTTDEKYNYGKMLLTISIKQKQSSLHLTTSMAGSKNNLKERIIMLSNNKKRFKKYHAVLAALITVILAGCGMTKEKITVGNTADSNAINKVNKTEEIKPPVKEINNTNTATSDNYDKYHIEKIFQDFISNGIKSRPEWSKWKDSTKNLYFSIQYTTDNNPCLLVTTDVITDTNETINAFVYYYDTSQENIELLTYLASNGTADPLKIKEGKFVITTHHSLRIYNWPGNGDELSASEIYGYFMDKENYTYTCLRWNVPFYNRKIRLDARKSYSKDKIDTYAYNTATEQNFPKNKADYIYKTYSDADPVPFYRNTEKNWNKFYNEGSFKTNIHRITWHGCNNNEINDNDSIIMDIVNKLSPGNFITAEENSPILINSAKLNYAGKFSGEEVLYFLNYGYTLRAFILRTGKPEYASYDVYILDTSHWNQKDVKRDKESQDNSPEIFTQLRKSKLARADFDNDDETEIAFYITENPYTLDGYKTFYIFDPKSYENGYKEYELYSYTKDDYRYFTEQVLINFDSYENQNLNKQTKAPDFFDNITKKPDKNYSYKSKKNTIPKVRDTFSDYNYIIKDKNYKNIYEFGSQNNYNITLEDDKTEIITRIGISYNKKEEKQKHNIELGATFQYKGNGKFVLKAPYYFKSID
ncbi:MAG: M56 family metallopeptidase [Lachnospiraceae bacterium]